VRPPVVIDTNVLVAANYRCAHASVACADACVDRLDRVRRDGRVALDAGPLITNEYMDNASLSGEPGVGDAFLQWLWDNQGVDEHCVRVPITPRDNDLGEDYEEFPAHEGLAHFDPSDRKFVAVACVAKAPILEAVDTDYWLARRALAGAGVDVEFLCQHDIRKAAESPSATRKD
jgi:hypothetical protein